MDGRNGHPIVVLNDPSRRRALPIWIGMFEATAITRALDNYKPERPMTHDLLLGLIQETGYKVKHVEINELASGTYFATIVLKFAEAQGEEEGLKLVDARPSDAIALALRAKASIFVAPQVLADGAIAADLEQDEKESEEFKQFIEGLKASDFSLNKGEDMTVEPEDKGSAE
ncbi:MAG: bifunctional nuclease family protein [Candidatus Obscuribacterales bacterium]|nr:bifunctional nuclease family protein [Candidatus Obscuribacterales bacterium]